MLDTKYDHKKVELDKYENWKSKGYFNCGDTSKTPFTIILPPPNVTGKLHLGHAWDVSPHLKYPFSFQFSYLLDSTFL